ncbi:sensor histidine kinase [Aerococcus sp. Group 1]|uniref:sensor histidine kinase n=1 Tax=Aerococcus urinae (strain CCUG 59500 / ACS-120-V-Col10a) TaxID=2976812 RepID=UPI00227AF7E5|nr:HAMP domain-containing sensor histidine kinase [Aerococcus sp. Group 1]MCY3061265.1 HAMP domain-containing histidine kinase [Aerococcus sp. Group 1]
MVLYLLLSLLVILGLVTYLYLSQKEITYISQQLADIHKRKTNKLLRQRVYSPAFNQLVERINAGLTQERELRLTLEKKERLQQEFLTNLSHDLRTPLTSIKGYIQLLEIAQSQADRDHYLSILSGRLGRLTLLLDQLFAYMTIEDDDYPLHIERIDLKEELVTHFLAYYDQFQGQGMDLDFTLSDQPVYILGDRNLLQRVFENLIKNTLKHAYRKVQVSLDKQGRLVLRNDLAEPLSLPAKDLFQRFQSGHDQSPSNTSGLGLNIVQAALKKMGATSVTEACDHQFILKIDFSGTVVKD